MRRSLQHSYVRFSGSGSKLVPGETNRHDNTWQNMTNLKYFNDLKWQGLLFSKYLSLLSLQCRTAWLASLHKSHQAVIQPRDCGKVDRGAVLLHMATVPSHFLEAWRILTYSQVFTSWSEDRFMSIQFYLIIYCVYVYLKLSGLCRSSKSAKLLPLLRWPVIQPQGFKDIGFLRDRHLVWRGRLVPSLILFIYLNKSLQTCIYKIV